MLRTSKALKPPIKANSILIVALILYSILGLMALKFYRYQLNPDGISYISIGQEYMKADFENAVNGYWGPLLSWLLIPFLHFRVEPLVAAKCLSLVIGGLSIVGVKLLSHKFGINERMRAMILFPLIPIILNFSMTTITPDLLITCLLIFYLNVIFSPDYPTSRHKGLLCGALGSLAYLSKHYGFSFFLVHFSLINAFYYFRNAAQERIKVIKNFILGLAIFSIISGSWVVVLSHKYAQVTFGTSAKYNFALVGPESYGRLVDDQGLLEPSHQTAVSAWEDPSRLKLRPWNPFQSLKYFFHGIKVLLKGVATIIFIFHSFSILSVPILVVFILFCVQPIKTLISKSEELFPLITVIIYSAGLSFFIIQERYLWLVNILLMLMGGYVLKKLTITDFFNRTRRKILFALFIFSFIALPLVNLTFNLNAGRDTYRLSQVLQEKYHIRGRIASIGHWNRTLCLSYFLKSQYYGQVKKTTSQKELLNELKTYKIDYLFVWDESRLRFSLFDDDKDLASGELPGLRIFSLKDVYRP